jgi:hypothetical protein
MLGLETSQVAGNPEQLADEILHVRRHFDEKLGLLLAGKSARVCPGIEQALRERRVSCTQLFQEYFVQARQPLLAVQILKRESKLKVELVKSGMHLQGQPG